MSEVFRFAVPQGLISANPATGVIAHPRPADRPRANRPWQVHELDHVLNTAQPHIVVVIALIADFGMDPSDALTLGRSAIKDGAIWRHRAKTDEATGIKIGKRLNDALIAAPSHNAITVLASTYGLPWTYTVFRPCGIVTSQSRSRTAILRPTGRLGACGTWWRRS